MIGMNTPPSAVHPVIFFRSFEIFRRQSIRHQNIKFREPKLVFKRSYFINQLTIF